MSKFITALILLFISLNLHSAELLTGAQQTHRYFPILANKKVGLVVNQTSRVGNQHLVDLLLQNQMNVVRVFAPEHGFRGDHGAGEKVSDAIDPSTGIPISSIYGKTKKPTPAMLQDVDILVFDIQDVGARFYTYISTLHYVMEAAAEQGIEVLVLDRPNPNGNYIDGPSLDMAYQSFVGMHKIPILHGMTVAELALMIKGEEWIHGAKELQLKVIPVANYNKAMQYDLPIAPSPNLPNATAVALYPSLCLFEATAVSVGRGTAFPFQVIGHNKVKLGNFTFTPKSLPKSAPSPKLQDTLLWGQDLRHTDIQGLDMELFVSVYQQFKQANEAFFTRPDFMDLLSGGPHLREQIEAGWSAQQIKQSWQDSLDAFKQQRQPYLLYPLNG
jgi:uncharacterized protein YbbC (DUF1343 family)